MTSSPDHFYDKFIKQCIALPLGKCLPVPRDFFPEEESSDDEYESLYEELQRHRTGWTYLEKLQEDCYHPLSTSDALVPLIVEGKWVVYHLSL